MKLYDESIEGVARILNTLPKKRLTIAGAATNWPDIGGKNMILRQDMAYELGGRDLKALSGLAVTSDQKLVSEDEVRLYGPDLGEIKEDISYARLAIVRVKEDSLGEGNSLYNAIRGMEYARYHMNPKGYMMRISASNQREPVRIGREALEEGLDYAKVGKLFLDAYHKNPKVEAVKLLFITLLDFPYKELAIEIERMEQITAAIDHIFKELVMDCNACNLKPVCDEVEGMKELHFSTMNAAVGVSSNGN